MISFKLSAHFHHYLNALRGENKRIGFIPTMGALHQGHLSLIQASKTENDITVCSIFVNPTQFNNADDLKNYPRTIEKDLELLTSVGCDVVFIPDVKEVYADKADYAFDLGVADKVMEATHRPGHFNGVINVVKRLFDLVQPNKAYFGQKDFQQCLVIKKMVDHYAMPVELVFCATTRETDGLAMSSRNMRLSTEERQIAPYIYKVLQGAKTQFADTSPYELKNWVSHELLKQPMLELEYFDVCDAATLSPLQSWDDAQNIVACIAVHLGPVRLIDNILLK